MKHISPSTVVHDPRASSELLHRFFEAQALRRPDFPAVECNGETLTYGQLNARAERVARWLQAEGIKQNALVALFMMKSCDLFAAMLGVLKAGAGYVPLDPKFPAGRIQSIVDDARIQIILTDEVLNASLAGVAGTKIAPGDITWNDDLPASAPSDVTPSDACYVIYTSGSTGKPKGVVIEHRNATNFVRSLRDVYKVDENHRVYQGFSVAFDASVEEIWAAFSVGATLVVPTEEVAHSAPDAAEFIKREQITYFSTVPSFLALLPPPIETLRLLVLGGEVCPNHLISKWARPGLRILNTYGPTEATVVATLLECSATEPVSIGSALPGYITHVLDDEQRPVNVGGTGELYIGGAGVARGYLNRSELTEERFICLPAINGSHRLYRTNDLVCVLPGGQLQFVGRRDSQVKVRGFRVELSEIECVLAECRGVRQAAAKVISLDGVPEIAAFVVPEAESDDVDRAALLAAFRHRLPDYMIPKYLDAVRVLPTMTSGKIDRQALPLPISLLRDTTKKFSAPENNLQRMLVNACQSILHIDSVSIDEDFFVDMRGHSFTAARLASEVRAKMQGIDISVRDFYDCRTIRILAGVLQQRVESLSEDDADAPAQHSVFAAPAPPNLPTTRMLCVLLQIVGLIAYYGTVALPVSAAVVLVMQVVDGSVSWERASAIATLGGFAIWPSWLLLGIALKWTVIGRYKAGRYPVWGLYYFRWWLVTRFQSLGWSEMFVDTPLMSIYYRAMGAKVGKNCNMGTPICAAFDLVTIGENSSLGAETHILGYKVENGWLILGPVAIGANCYVGTHCALGLNVQMEDGSYLEDLSSLPDGETIGFGETKRGSPPQDVARTNQAPAKVHGRLLNALFGMIHLLLIYGMGYILILSAAPALVVVALAVYGGGPAAGLLAAIASVPISVLWFMQIVMTVRRRFIGRIRPGTYSTRSLTFLRYWFLRYLMTNTRHILLPLYATLFLPGFLRSLGAKIGRHVEISTITQTVPDLLEIGDGSFLADACIVGGHHIFGGQIELRRNRVGSRTFVGNSALVPAGINLGEDSLIGVLSRPPAELDETPAKTRWLGSPGFLLPTSETVTSFSNRHTYNPGFRRIWSRGLVDLLRVVLPGMMSVALTGLFCLMVAVSYWKLSVPETLALTPVFAFLTALLTLIAVAMLRHTFMGRFKPTVKPLWCAYVWFNEVVNALYESVAAPILAPMLGTIFVSWFLRQLGCRIGRWVFLETTLFSEFDLVRIEDRASLNLGCTIQTHLFEDRVMKSDTIHVGELCSVQNMAVVLYGTRMGAGSVLGPLSVLMKGEVLPSRTRSYGIPSQPMRRANRQHRRRKLSRELSHISRLNEPVLGSTSARAARPRVTAGRAAAHT